MRDGPMKGAAIKMDFGGGESIPGGRNGVSKDLEMGNLREGVGTWDGDHGCLVEHLPGCFGQGGVQSEYGKEVESGLSGYFG